MPKGYLKTTKWFSDTINRTRTENTMGKRKRTKEKVKKRTNNDLQITTQKTRYNSKMTRNITLTGRDTRT